MKPTAQLVYDGRTFQIPEACGAPAADQMLGTVGERLAELCGRECYDSLGRGRNSSDYHKHVLEVGHYSVYEHFNFTLLIRGVAFEPEVLLDVMNRPGLYARVEGSDLRLTLNLRCILDWPKWRPPHREAFPCPMSLVIPACEIAPKVFPLTSFVDTPPPESKLGNVVFVDPIDNEERWITLRLTGSRGFSHELVRHGDRTAISQRSTRYVEESNSEWCLHPLIHEAFNADDVARGGAFIDSARGMYDLTVRKGETLLKVRGVDKGTARKQARGAARGWLGNALGTSVIFSASVGQWRRMMGLRAHVSADAEIRDVFAQALGCLKGSQYAGHFADLQLRPSQDGIGQVLDDA